MEHWLEMGIVGIVCLLLIGYNLFQLLKQLQLADADSVKLKDYVSKLLDKLQG